MHSSITAHFFFLCILKVLSSSVPWGTLHDQAELYSLWNDTTLKGHCASLLGTLVFINKLFIDNFLLPSTASHSPSLQVASIPTPSPGVANSRYYYFYFKFSFLIRLHIFLITCSVRLTVTRQKSRHTLGSLSQGYNY